MARGSSPVVDGLTVELGAGGIFWVVGPNGAGKSTLLRVLAGLDLPRAGTVTRVPERGRILYYASEMALPPASTVGDWGRLVRRLGRGGVGGDRTSIWPTVPAGRRVKKLSTGERKRLLLDALLRQPGPMVLDEPFEHLSSGAKADLHGLLEARARTDLVVVATNQWVDRARRDGGLRLEGGMATLVGPGLRSTRREGGR